jgi:hypothetical protein
MIIIIGLLYIDHAQSWLNTFLVNNNIDTYTYVLCCDLFDIKKEIKNLCIAVDKKGQQII